MVKGLPPTLFVFDDIHRNILVDMVYYLVCVISSAVLKFSATYMVVVTY